MKIMLLLSCFLLGCTTNNNSNKSGIQKEISEAIDIFGSEVKNLPIYTTTPLDKFEINNWLKKNYFNDNEIEIELVRELKNMTIFKIMIKEDVPNNVPINYTFISTDNENGYFLLPIDFTDILDIGSDLMIGGIYSYREYEYFFIYRLESDVVKLVLDSRNINGKSVKSGYYRDDDCFEYQPNRLLYRFDGKKSVFFDGKLKIFCKYGFDRDPKMKHPIDENKISVRLDYNGEFWIYNVNSKYESW